MKIKGKCLFIWGDNVELVSLRLLCTALESVCFSDVAKAEL